MEKIRQGAIAVLTHKDNVVFLPLPEEDVAPIGNGGKEKRVGSIPLSPIFI